MDKIEKMVKTDVAPRVRILVVRDDLWRKRKKEVKGIHENIAKQ